MDWHFYPWYHIPSILSTILALGVAAIAWRKRAYPGAFPAFLELLALALCTGASIFEIAAPDMATKLFWVKVEYPGIATVPTLWFILNIHYLGHRHFFTRRNLALLFAIPVASVLLNWTNDWHHLFYAHTWLDKTQSIPALAMKYGVWGWLSIAYGYLLCMGASAFCLHAIVTAPKLYRRQSLILFGSAVLPLIASLLYILHLGPISHLDLTPLAFISSCALAVYGVSRFQLWKIIPVAHQKIVGQMREGILVCDDQSRIIEINPAACQILSLTPDEALGFPFKEVLPTWLHPLHLSQGEPALFSPEDGARVYEMRMSPLELYLQDPGQLIVLRDVTADLNAFEERERSKIAQYLHDDIGQTLAGAMMHLSIARRRSGEDVQLEKVEALLESAIRHARAITTGLSMTTSVQELSVLAEQLRSLYGLEIDIQGEEHLRQLSKQQSSILYRILRELLFNIIKHAGSNRAWISIIQQSNHLLARVEDEGIGIQGKEGFGLSSIRGQLSLIGGKMEIGARQGVGTRVDIEIPAV